MTPKRDKPWSKTGPGGPWDYIVIGSGMGGMTTAALLSEVGKRVLVLEQHYVPGGFTHTFQRQGYRWDVGVHAVGEVTNKSLTGRLLTRLTRGRLRWASLGPVYDEFHFPDGFRIDFPDNPKQFRRNLVEAFPEEAEAIDRYLAETRSVAGAMKSYYLARTLPRRIAQVADFLVGRKAQADLERRTADVLRDLTTNERLRTVLASQWGYYGSTPERSSFAIQALVTHHFKWGGFYPVGGSREIARWLLQRVADAGGWTRVATDVEEILLEGDAAVGVRLAGGEVIRARRVVSAAGIGATVRNLLPARLQREAWVREVSALPPAPAHVCLYLGFKGDIRQAGASAANKWFYNTWRTDLKAWEVAPGQEALPETPVLYCSFPSLKDPEHDPGPQERHTGEVVTFVPWDAFSRWRDTRWKRRPEEYEQLKTQMQESLLSQLLARMPELEPMVDYVELSTPLSTDNFARPVRGSIYGLEPTPDRFRNPWLRPRSPIRNLLFSGSEVATVGVIGAMMGGVLCAVSAEPISMVRLLGTE